ncbi:MAG TPA: hypothetical protein VHH33_04365 [Nitrososphaeraceae archaeon]|jgi:hypothetical protein|nr:hypothetical protein [Nitrososphaeraceae archaeon]
MGTQINNRKTILILAGIFSPFFLAFFLAIAVIEPEETKRKNQHLQFQYLKNYNKQLQDR